MDFEDEKEDRIEGLLLSKILHLGEKKSRYYYFRTKKELIELMKLYKESNYRYLHLSCHGTSSSIETTLDSIKFYQFRKIVRPFLKNRRLFISACDVVNDRLAKLVIPSSGCRSIVGPITTIDFDKAAIMWASFYHLVFEAERRKITNATLETTIQKVVDTFGDSFNIYFRSKRLNYTHKLIEPIGEDAN